MPDNGAKNPVEPNQGAAEKAARSKLSLPVTRWYRTRLFWGAMFFVIGAFSLLTFFVVTVPSFTLDLQITHAIQSIESPLFASVMRIISWPGFLPQSVLITGLIALGLFVNGLRWEAFVAPLAALCSGVTNQLIKMFIQRPRPAGDLVEVFEVLETYSFPSGHVMMYMILFGFVWYVAYTLLRRSWQRSLLLGLFGSFIALVGISRIYLGQHWASDVVGAYLLGSVILVGIIILYQWGKPRLSPKE